MSVQEVLANRFGLDDVNLMSCVYIDDGENSMRYLMEKYGPFNHAIEIGTFRGVSTAILSEYCNIIDCVDIVDQPERKVYWDFLEIKNAKYHLASDDTDKCRIVKELIANNEIDFVFVDGDHSYESAREDIDLCDCIKTVLVHDYNEQHFPGVVKAVDETVGKTERKNLFVMIRRA